MPFQKGKTLPFDELIILDNRNLGAENASGESACVRRVREVVLLTDDRNLRVKALAAELPTRDLPSFVQWAGLSRDDAAVAEPASTTATATVSTSMPTLHASFPLMKQMIPL